MKEVCKDCKNYVPAAISKIPGDLGTAEINHRRHACLNPESGIVVIFHYKDKGIGHCEQFGKR